MERSNGDVYAADGKWRFMVHDFDLAFDGAESNTMEYALKSNLPPTEPRHPQFTAEILEGLFKNEEFRNRFAQRSMAYISTIVSEEKISEIISCMIEEREAVKSFDLMRWDNMSGTSKNRLESWKYAVVNKFVGFAHNRNAYFEKMISDFYKKYYNSSIGDTALCRFDIDTSVASVDIAGAVIRESFYGDKAKDFTAKLYTNIPVRISAEVKDGYFVRAITVTDGNSVQTFSGNNAVFTPLNKEYKVSFDIALGAAEKTPAMAIAVLRKDRFSRMKAGERLPVEINAVDASGNVTKAFGFECVCDSDIIEIGDNNIITAKAAGNALVTVRYGNCTEVFNVAVTK